VYDDVMLLLLLRRWGKEALSRVYDDVMFKSMPMPGVKLPEPESDEEDEQQPGSSREPGVSQPAKQHVASHVTLATSCT
jgi:hypothetical protein